MATSSVTVVSDDAARLLAHVMGGHIDGAVHIAESMSPEQRASISAQLNRTLAVISFASARESDLAQFIRANTQNGA